MSAPREAEGPIALICGAGTLPLAVADFLAARGRDVLLLPLQGVANENDYRTRPHTPIRVVQLGPLKRAMRAANCRELVLIGAMVRPAFWRMRFDWDSLKLLPRIAAAFRGGDDHLLRGVAKLFEQKGVRLLGAHEVAPEILVPDGLLGRLQPSDAEREDVAFGLAYLHAA